MCEIVAVMTDMTPVGIEDWDALRQAVRSHNTAKIRELLSALEPGVMGWTGPINPALVKVYLQALRELGQLYQAYEAPKQTVEAGTAELALETQRAVVLAELETLASKAAKRHVPAGERGAARELG